MSLLTEDFVLEYSLLLVHRGNKAREQVQERQRLKRKVEVRQALKQQQKKAAVSIQSGMQTYTDISYWTWLALTVLLFLTKFAIIRSYCTVISS